MSARSLGFAALAVATLAATPTSAVSLSNAAGRYTISPGGSSIRFSIGNMGGGSLNGAFAKFAGTIRIDDKDVGRSTVNIIIYPASVGTGQERIDAFLRSDAVFDTTNEREILFRSSSVTRTGDATAVVTGDLTARGRTYPEQFTVRLAGLKSGRIDFRVTGKVLRSRYGMGVGTPIYSNIVDFDMMLSGRRG